MPTIDLANAVSAVPSEISGVRASPMPPVTWAGLQLAKVVLSILAAALAVLMLYLWTIEWRYGSHQSLVYDHVMSQANALLDEQSRQSQTKQIKLLRDAAQNPSLEVSAAEASAARNQFASAKV